VRRRRHTASQAPRTVADTTLMPTRDRCAQTEALLHLTCRPTMPVMIEYTDDARALMMTEWVEYESLVPRLMNAATSGNLSMAKALVDAGAGNLKGARQAAAAAGYDHLEQWFASVILDRLDCTVSLENRFKAAQH
jgi:hypothetical protein